jgi:hypothetical protein
LHTWRYSKDSTSIFQASPWEVRIFGSAPHTKSSCFLKNTLKIKLIHIKIVMGQKIANRLLHGNSFCSSSQVTWIVLEFFIENKGIVRWSFLHIHWTIKTCLWQQWMWNHWDNWWLIICCWLKHVKGYNLYEGKEWPFNVLFIYTVLNTNYWIIVNNC